VRPAHGDGVPSCGVPQRGAPERMCWKTALDLHARCVRSFRCAFVAGSQTGSKKLKTRSRKYPELAHSLRSSRRRPAHATHFPSRSHASTASKPPPTSTAAAAACAATVTAAPPPPSAVLTNARLMTSRKFLSRSTGFSHSSLLDTSPWVKNEGRLSQHRKSLTTPLPWALRPLFLTSSDRGRQYDHDRRDTREHNAHGRGVVKLFLFF